MEYLRIDGSYGEGGGQILRTALSLSCITAKPIEIYNIRKGRPKPGLQPQHLTCVKGAAEICDAKVEGAELGSERIRFSPAKIKSGKFTFDVAEKKGSAGSIGLIFQTIFPPLALSGAESEVVLYGGTHVPWSPSFHYLKYVFLQMIKKLGVQADIDIERWGWYPIGKGKIVAKIYPKREGINLNLESRGELKKLTGISAVSNLPLSIAERQKNKGIKILDKYGLKIDVELIEAPSLGKGTLFFILAEFENCLAGFDALGAIGKRAEDVAKEACEDFLRYYQAKSHSPEGGGACLEPHLADQLILYLALENKKASFTTSLVSRHLSTNVWTVKNFLPVDILVAGSEGGPGRFIINV
ncbi:MAG: hypothetical protein AMJ78_08105 [Omnitrophica WOR_2 bacterium SM23_29]|nr:MAG: hypothetical protein AMJ78_08105 [Omnitrophica WOR_2 bacterium SM23_29]